MALVAALAWPADVPPAAGPAAPAPAEALDPRPAVQPRTTVRRTGQPVPAPRRTAAVLTAPPSRASEAPAPAPAVDVLPSPEPPTTTRPDLEECLEDLLLDTRLHC
ncbi:MAG TPA: hypothetical protein VNU26_15295 [Mycobacteriales bacterium]|nr:hypothetical protein [Mycobacteriales bacterium]